MSRRSAPCGSSSTHGDGRGCPGTCAPANAWPETAHEVLVELKPPPQDLFADAERRRPAVPTICDSGSPPVPPSLLPLASSAQGKEFVGDQRELYLVEEQPGEESPYERLLGDAMAGDGALFTREDAVEAAWAVVEPVLGRSTTQTCPYQTGSWGPREADDLIASRRLLAYQSESPATAGVLDVRGAQGEGVESSSRSTAEETLAKTSSRQVREVP